MSAIPDPASLDALHGIVVPEPIGFWPVAPGWIALAVLLGTGAVLCAGYGYRRYRRNAYRRRALAELRSLDADDLGRLPVLLKSTALAAFPRERVASLSGPAWWRLLDDSAGVDLFCHGRGALLDALAYRNTALPLSAGERRALIDAAALWVRRHRVPPA